MIYRPALMLLVFVTLLTDKNITCIPSIFHNNKIVNFKEKECITVTIDFTNKKLINKLPFI